MLLSATDYPELTTLVARIAHIANRVAATATS
jgi:hypothetical protein